MNAHTSGCEASAVKEALCRHFQLPRTGAHLRTTEKRFRISRGYQSRYYVFAITDGRVTHRAFGKMAFNNEREYRALRHLMDTIPEGQRHFSRPIALLNHGDRSLLLLEYLEGCSSLLSLRNLLRLIPDRSRKTAHMGKIILDKMYDVQRHGAAVYRKLSSQETEATPGQPTPTGVLRQLECIHSLSVETKAALRARINAIVANGTMARRGVVHGALGMRNIMVGRSNISFIDWEFMEKEALSIYDPCYIATMALMGSFQLCIPRAQLDVIHDSFFEHIYQLEERLSGATHKRFIHDTLWFAKCLAMIDTLWAYERSGGSRVKALLGQRGRKIKYLAYRIEKEATKAGNCLV